MELVVLFLQCVTLYILVTIAAMLEQRQSAPGKTKQLRWAVHVVRDTDANHTLSVLLRHTGTLIEWDSETHSAIMQASQHNSTQNLLSGGSLRSPDGVQIEFVRVVHTSVDTEHMQQLLEKHLCDMVSVDTDAPDPVVILDDIYALLGVFLSQHCVIPLSVTECDSTHPSTPTKLPTSPRCTPRCRRTAHASPTKNGDP